MNFRSNRFGRKQKSPLAGAFGDLGRRQFKLFGRFFSDIGKHGKIV
jgi:hypothetical protein